MRVRGYTAALLLVCSLASVVADAGDAAPATGRPGEGGSVSPYSFRPDSLRSCYRWMSSWERSRWLAHQHPQFTSSSFLWKDTLGRLGKEELNVLFCWANPAGGMIGGKHQNGIIEKYGQVLVRVDFVKSAVVFDRSLGKYFKAIDSTEVPEPKDGPKEVSTEIVYANYFFKGSPWYQEILVRDPSVIKSWSFGDAALQSEFRSESARFLKGEYEEIELHYFRNMIEHDEAFFEWSGRPYYEKYLREAGEKLEEYWKDGGDTRTFMNSSAHE